MTRKLTLIALALSSLSVAHSFAQEPSAGGQAHNIVAPGEVKWGEGPPSLPPGAKMSVLYGDPSKTGPFIIRLKTPANYKIPAHWHPTDENITVISGTFMMGMGDKLDAKAVKQIPAGGFASMPAKMHHFAMTKGEVVVQVSSTGPFVVNYINPEDDPSRSPPKAAAPTAK